MNNMRTNASLSVVVLSLLLSAQFGMAEDNRASHGVPNRGPQTRSAAPVFRPAARPVARSIAQPVRPIYHGSAPSHFDFPNDMNGSSRINRSAPIAAPNRPNRQVPVARRVVGNPHRYGAWGWHQGHAWAPEPRYWGGGFWGALALGIALDTAIPVAPDSPGATLLNDYGLTQVPCSDDPSLVVIDGPNGSVLCAYPNDMVASGTYTVDFSTLTLESV
ncbi:MAG TPA: hypothetical protein VGZ00_00740 [Candidatus Baltobacteraceae bacterium]|jgi:hypothetical protein|nr:hypothetical protein [Candidatus Baltobacteraceae bacterium]